MQKTKSLSASTLFNIVLVFGLLFVISLTLAGLLLAPSFFIKYSPDHVLKESTLKSILMLRLSGLSLGAFFALIILFLSIKKERTLNYLDMHSDFLTNIFTLLVFIIIFLVCAEIAARLLLKNETSEQGVGPGSLKFNIDWVSLNSYGMRDKEYSLAKPQGVYRIAVIGDSFTFGSGIKNVSNTYPKVLETKLNSKNYTSTFDVLNFGIPGYDAP